MSLCSCQIDAPTLQLVEIDCPQHWHDRVQLGIRIAVWGKGLCLKVCRFPSMKMLVWNALSNPLLYWCCVNHPPPMYSCPCGNSQTDDPKILSFARGQTTFNPRRVLPSPLLRTGVPFPSLRFASNLSSAVRLVLGSQDLPFRETFH